MRLTPREIGAIQRVTAEAAGPLARVSHFGSRTRVNLHGGDIGLLLELPVPTADKLGLALRTGTRLQMATGERKIDVPVTDPFTEEKALTRTARRDGIVL